jgi:hypothetical protein
MKYTVQVPVLMTLEVEADSIEDALDEAAATLQDADITMACEYSYEENWENVEVYDQDGNCLEVA